MTNTKCVALGGRGEVGGGFVNGGEGRDDFVDFGLFEAARDKRGRGCEAQAASGGSQFFRAENHGADGGAVHGDDFRQIEDHVDVLFFEEGVHFGFKLSALLTAMDAALKGEDGYAGLKLMFCESHGHGGERSWHSITH